MFNREGIVHPCLVFYSRLRFPGGFVLLSGRLMSSGINQVNVQNLTGGDMMTGLNMKT